MDYKNRSHIDLHIHSTASDGTLTPAEILELANQLKLGAISITDHDTIEGSREAVQAGIPPELGFLTGVEVSAGYPPGYHFTGSLHLLGYGIRLDDIHLNRVMQQQQEARQNRNPQIVARLNQMGVPISLEEIAAEIGDSQIGRPHIARLLVEKGIAGSINDAFDRFLGKGQPAYVEKFVIECEKAMQMITSAGGVPVLAHPFLLKFQTSGELETFIQVLIDMGLKGIEVYYSDHTPSQTAMYAELARRYDLLPTGGSDFHGSLIPDIHMGTGRGELAVTYEIFERLKRLAS